MAFLKSIPTDFGASAQYWRVIGVTDDLVNRTPDLTVPGCFNEEARHAGRQPMTIWRGRIEGTAIAGRRRSQTSTQC